MEVTFAIVLGIGAYLLGLWCASRSKITDDDKQEIFVDLLDQYDKGAMAFRQNEPLKCDAETAEEFAYVSGYLREMERFR